MLTLIPLWLEPKGQTFWVLQGVELFLWESAEQIYQLWSSKENLCSNISKETDLCVPLLGEP